MDKVKSILLKLSGEGFANSDTRILDYERVSFLAKDIKFLLKKGINISIVIGGGNICRGADLQNTKLQRNTLDNIGMLSTIMNGLALGDLLLQNGIPNVVMSALEINKVANFYNVHSAKLALRENLVVILVGGTSCAFVSTDTAAVIRAAELGCDAIFKITQVSGVFDKDPARHKNAKKLDVTSYDEVISKQLKIMDLAAVVLAKSIKIPIYVFNRLTPITEVFKNRCSYSVIQDTDGK